MSGIFCLAMHHTDRWKKGHRTTSVRVIILPSFTSALSILLRTSRLGGKTSKGFDSWRSTFNYLVYEQLSPVCFSPDDLSPLRRRRPPPLSGHVTLLPPVTAPHDRTVCSGRYIVETSVSICFPSLSERAVCYLSGIAARVNSAFTVNCIPMRIRY